MTVTMERYATRLEWLAARLSGIGGSEAPVLASPGMGYGSEYSIWSSKCGLVPLDSDDMPEYVEAGTFMEPAILRWWAHRMDESVMPTPLTILRSSEFPWMFASPDALVGEDAGLDAKNIDLRRGDEYADGAPMDVQIQGQHYLAVTGRQRWHFAAVVGGNQLKCSTIERDEKFIAALIERERQWWQTHVVGKSPPEPDSSEATARAIKRAWPHHEAGEARALDESFAALALRLDAAKTERSILDDEIRGIESKIKAALGTAEVGVLPDWSQFSYREQSRAEYVCAATSFRVLRFKAAKAPGGRR